MKTRLKSRGLLLTSVLGMSLSASMPRSIASPTGERPTPCHSRQKGARAVARIRSPDTVMYYVTGDARSAVVSYTDARGVDVYAGFVRFPWKVYLHPKKGAHLYVCAAVSTENPGVTVGIWVNGKLVAGGVSDGDSRAYTEASATLGDGHSVHDGPADGDAPAPLPEMYWPQVGYPPLHP